MVSSRLYLFQVHTRAYRTRLRGAGSEIREDTGEKAVLERGIVSYSDGKQRMQVIYVIYMTWRL